ncbi:flagellar hook-basal body complex protein FliE, partial [Pseudomonas sp. CM25]|nr:flagellar hook-basal body complex protein FliE [Pseudomonas sp. CM25]
NKLVQAYQDIMQMPV